MRKTKFVMSFFVALLCLCCCSTSILAMHTGFSTQTVNPADQNTFLSNLHLVKEELEPTQSGITCFDVNTDGLIAIGRGSSSRKSVSIYDLSGNYQYSYVFNCSGTFGVEWDADDLIIYFVRRDIAASVDENGTILELQKIENTTNNNSYWNHSVFSTQRTVGNDTYIIKNDMGLFNSLATSYSQLIAVDAQGNQTMLYDANNVQMTKTIVVFIAAILFAAIVVSLVIREFLKLRKK